MAVSYRFSVNYLYAFRSVHTDWSDRFRIRLRFRVDASDRQSPFRSRAIMLTTSYHCTVTRMAGQMYLCHVKKLPATDYRIPRITKPILKIWPKKKNWYLSVQTLSNILLDNEFRSFNFLVTYSLYTFVFRVVVRCTSVFGSMWISRISPPPHLRLGTANPRSRHARVVELSACTHQDNDVTYVIKHNLQVGTSKRNDFDESRTCTCRI